MKISYKKLWHLLLDRNISKKGLAEKAGIGEATIYKLTKDVSVNTSIIVKICQALECDLTDIMELVSTEADNDD